MQIATPQTTPAGIDFLPYLAGSSRKTFGRSLKRPSYVGSAAPIESLRSRVSVLSRSSSFDTCPEAFPQRNTLPFPCSLIEGEQPSTDDVAVFALRRTLAHGLRQLIRLP